MFRCTVHRELAPAEMFKCIAAEQLLRARQLPLHSTSQVCAIAPKPVAQYNASLRNRAKTRCTVHRKLRERAKTRCTVQRKMWERAKSRCTVHRKMCDCAKSRCTVRREMVLPPQKNGAPKRTVPPKERCQKNGASRSDEILPKTTAARTAARTKSCPKQRCQPLGRNPPQKNGASRSDEILRYPSVSLGANLLASDLMSARNEGDRPADDLSRLRPPTISRSGCTQEPKARKAPPRRRPAPTSSPAGDRPSLGAERQGGREAPFWEDGSAIAAS